MQWRRSRQSGNIEDRRGMGASMGGRGLKIGGGGGLGIVAIAVIAMLFGVDPSIVFQVLGGLEGSGGGGYTETSEPMPRSGPRSEPRPGDDQDRDFVAAVLGDTEDTWREIFTRSGATYEEPPLVLFSGGVESACGFAQSATGPFYCPGDRKVYLDTVFFDELARRFAAPGDFAAAYVIAHEVGHHVQTLQGISRQVREAQGRVSRAEANQLSVMMELQADCYAGVWAHHADAARGLLEAGDIEEGLAAASAVGDDTIQKTTQGYVVPDAFTHGSAEQRARWFRQGLQAGDPASCDTFGAASL